MRQCLPIKVDRGGTGPDQVWTSVLVQGGVTPIDSIVTAAAALVNPYTKEEVESLHILPYTSVNVRIVNGQLLKFNAVNGQGPKYQRGQRSKCRKELVKILTLRLQLWLAIE